jgi:hypothetical protein
MKFINVCAFCIILFFIKASAQLNNAGFSKNLFFEKVYLHSDREVYIGGEDLWFSAYLVNAQNNNFINTSATLYIELVSTNRAVAEIIDKKIIKLTFGKGEGDFKLPDSLDAGTYQLRAWSNWMRNFGDHFLFSKEIKILKLADKPIAKSATNKESNPIPISSSKASIIGQENIQFFPEGGSLVENVGSIIAFKSTDGSGESIGISGEIIEQTGEVLTSFEGNSGIGIFTLLPQNGKNYIAKGTFSNGKTFNQALPNVLQKGYSIRVSEKETLFNVVVSTNEATGLDKQITLVAKSKGNLYYNLAFPLKSLQTLVQIPKKDLPEGIAALTLYDNLGRPNCERLIYIDKKESITLNIETNKAAYSPKEMVSLKFKALDNNNQPIKTIFSFVATDASIVGQSSMHILSYLMLQSELKGKIENPTQYFDAAVENRSRKLDLLLLTQGWRDFVWRKLADSAIKVTQIPEKGITLTGTVKQASSDRPIPNANITLFANGAQGNKLFSGKTDSTGMYYIDNVELYGPQYLKLTSTNDKGKKNGWLQMDSIFKEATFKNRVKSVSDTSKNLALAAEMVNRFINMKKVSVTDTIALREVKVNGGKNTRLFGDLTSEFGYKPEVFEVTADDNTFTDLRHYIQYKSNQARELEDPTNPGLYRLVFPYMGRNLQPRIVVNGKELPFTERDPQEIRDDYYNAYYSIKMNKVEKVVIRHLVGGNQMGFDDDAQMSTISGVRDIFVIYLTLKPGALAPRYSNIMNENVSGYYEARKFYQPTNNAASNVNDQRTTVYWNPKIETDEKGEATVTFYNSSLKTKVNIVAEGLTTTGQPVVKTATYEVK